MNRDLIISDHNWLMPSDATVDVMMGDDLDAALATVLFLHTHPNARLIGIYSQYRQVTFSSNVNWNAVLNAAWLDLDIYHPQVKCLGHHILRFSKSDLLPGLRNSCNLNELAGRTGQNFSEKYPLGTIHFLLWLYNLEIPNRPGADLLIWLADSAYINGQSQYWTRARGLARGYSWNVKNWLEKEIPVRSLLETFKQIDTRELECQMQAFQQAMNQRGFSRGYGQAASRHLRLSGYQCQPNPGNIASDIRQLLDFVSEVTGWTCSTRQVAEIGFWSQREYGVRKTVDLAQVRQIGLASFLEKENVFSYVMQSTQTLNYTQRMGATIQRLNVPQATTP